MIEPLSPFFKYFGSKNKLAQFYPEPKFDEIGESHAGGGGFSCRHHTRKVTLYDVDPRIIMIWSYLIAVKPAEIMALPLLEPGQSIDTLHVCPEARLFLSCCVNTSPFRKSLTSWKNGQNTGLWGPKWREKVARQVDAIKHWKAVCCSYENIPNRRCTWFVDPMYQGMEHHYWAAKHHPTDYEHLGQWCRSRLGQVIVCESMRATWLPFQPLGASAVQGGMLNQHKGTCTEAIWTADNDVVLPEPKKRQEQLSIFDGAAE